MGIKSFLTPRNGRSGGYHSRPSVSYDQHGNIFHGYDENNIPIIQDRVTGRLQLSPLSRNVGATPYARPQDNIGANPASDKIRAGWGWGSSPGDASSEIKAGWGRQKPGDAPAAPAKGNPGTAPAAATPGAGINPALAPAAAGIGNAAGRMAQGGVPGGIAGSAAGAVMGAATGQGQQQARQSKDEAVQGQVPANKGPVQSLPANDNPAGTSTAQAAKGVTMELPNLAGGIVEGGNDTIAGQLAALSQVYDPGMPLRPPPQGYRLGSSAQGGLISIANPLQAGNVTIGNGGSVTTDGGVKMTRTPGAPTVPISSPRVRVAAGPPAAAAPTAPAAESGNNVKQGSGNAAYDALSQLPFANGQRLHPSVTPGMVHQTGAGIYVDAPGGRQVAVMPTFEQTMHMRTGGQWQGWTPQQRGQYLRGQSVTPVAPVAPAAQPKTTPAGGAGATPGGGVRNFMDTLAGGAASGAVQDFTTKQNPQTPVYNVTYKNGDPLPGDGAAPSRLDMQGGLAIGAYGAPDKKDAGNPQLSTGTSTGGGGLILNGSNLSQFPGAISSQPVTSGGTGPQGLGTGQLTTNVGGKTTSFNMPADTETSVIPGQYIPFQPGD